MTLEQTLFKLKIPEHNRFFRNSIFAYNPPPLPPQSLAQTQNYSVPVEQQKL